MLGVDLGGTHLRVGRVMRDGTVAAAERVATDPAGPHAVIGQIAALAAGLRDAGTAAIGVGVPGTFVAATGTVLNIPALPGWAGTPLLARLRALTGLPGTLENDAKAAALGEWQAGAGRGCRNFAFVTVSTGIGAGVVVEGRLLRGLGGLAGEVGHMRITDDPTPCACGQTGCWQAVASGTALGQRATAALACLAPDAPSRLAFRAGDGPATGYHVGLAARAGDPLALQLLDETARLLGRGFINLHHCYAPERIVVGGGVSSLLDLMAARIAQTVADGLLPGFQAAEIRPAALGDDAGLVGAAFAATDLAMAVATDLAGGTAAGAA